MLGAWLAVRVRRNAPPPPFCPGVAEYSSGRHRNWPTAHPLANTKQKMPASCVHSPWSSAIASRRLLRDGELGRAGVELVAGPPALSPERRPCSGA
eukprot:15445299-Alexandrium_andersonii.AAC.1